ITSGIVNSSSLPDKPIPRPGHDRGDVSSTCSLPSGTRCTSGALNNPADDAPRSGRRQTPEKPPNLPTLLRQLAVSLRASPLYPKIDENRPLPYKPGNCPRWPGSTGPVHFGPGFAHA